MSGRTSPPAAFGPISTPSHGGFDPFRLCIYTTIGLLAWLVTPALIVAAFSGTALVAYQRARRAGLARSRCKLGDTRLVMVYLAVAFAGGVYGVTRTILGLM
jgi:hypothetical protein